MKNKSLVTGVLILAIVLGGAFAGLKFLESRVVAEIKNTIAASKDVQVGNMQFSLQQRLLVLADIRVTRQGAAGPEVHTVKNLQAVLPWDLIMPFASKGTVLAAERVEAEEVGFTQGDSNATVARKIMTGVYTDLELLRKALGSDSSLDWADVYEHSAVDEFVGKDFVFAAPDVLVKLDGITVRNLKGLKIGSAKWDNLLAVMPQEGQGDKALFQVAEFSLEDVEIPANALRMILEMEDAQIDSPEAVQALIQNMLGGQRPLFSRMNMRDFSLAEGIPLAIQSVLLEWDSVKPLRHRSTMTGLSIPMDFLEKEFGVDFPLLNNLVLDSKTTVEGDDAGKIRQHDIYKFENLADIETKIDLVLDHESTHLMPTIWDYGSLENAQFAGLDMTIQDRGLLSYFVWNAEGPDGTGEMLLQQIRMFGGSGTEAARAMTESLSAFVSHPGTLNIRFAPEEPMPLMAMMQILFDPSSLLHFSSTPGAVSLGELMQTLRDGVAALPGKE